MKRSKIVVSLLLLLFVLSGCTFLTKTGAITGTVNDAASGQAIPDATVTIKGSNTTPATTNASGAFSFQKLAYGNVELIVAAAGYITKTVPVAVNASTAVVNIQLEQTPLEVADAKKLVKDFRTSLYEVGSIGVNESGLVVQFKEDVQKFYADITPYLEELGYGLAHLQIVASVPGEYEYSGWDSNTGRPIYDLIEEYDRTGTKWSWKVVNPLTNMSVEINLPNIDSCFIENTDGSLTIDFTNAQFDCKLKSGLYQNAVYTGQVNIGNANVKSYQTTYEDKTITLKVPSGKTVTAKFVVDPKVDKVGSIDIDASFDLTEANSNLKMALDGSVKTPVFIYTGALSVEVKGLGTNITIDEGLLKPFTIKGTGKLENTLFTTTGSIAADVLVITVPMSDQPVICLPTTFEIDGSYTSSKTEFTGSIHVELLNGSSFTVNEIWIPEIEAAVNGQVKNQEQTYLLNLNAKFTDGENVKITTRLAATNKYDLAGNFSISLESGLTAASMVNENGLFIQFDVAATTPNNIGGIYQQKDGPKFATIAVVLENPENPVVSVNFTDNTSEIIPLNPLVYLVPGV